MSKMNAKHVSEVVDSWIAEEELPVSACLRQVRKYDLFSEMGEEDIEAYWEFIRWFMRQEHLLLESIPKPEEPDFYEVELDEFGNNVSPMNTYDFERLHPFDRYHYKVKKVCEKVKGLAIAHSCIRDVADRKKVKERFLNLVMNECTDKKVLFFEIWCKYAYWE